MEIQPIGAHNLLIFLSGDEVRGLPTTPDGIKTDDAAWILRAALGDGCEDGWQNVFLEMFTGRDCLLLFARAHSGSPRFFVFDGIEPLITAAGRCPAGVISFFIYCYDTYYLIVYPWNREAPPGALFEYGEELSLHPRCALHLTEHGTLLLGPSALDDLKKYF